jgi:hypothetical protein
MKLKRKPIERKYASASEIELVEDYLERRAALRDEHLRLAAIAFERGELVLAGALTIPS